MSDKADRQHDEVPPSGQPDPSTVDFAAPVHEQPTLVPGPPPDDNPHEQLTLVPGTGASPHDQPTVTPEALHFPQAGSTSDGDPQVTPPELEVSSLSDFLICEAQTFGEYELLGEIAKGGMGIVYRARERHSGRLVALKMMLARSGAGTIDLQRFQLEARATAELQHPGIVTIHTWGEHEGRFFYTMDYVPGFTLSRILRRGPLSPDRAVAYLLGVARAVAAAIARGIVHRDLKPSNVILDRANQPRVLDFGLAKRHRRVLGRDRSAAVRTEPSPDDIPLALPVRTESAEREEKHAPAQTPYATEKGSVLGTPSYMAPEQARGDQGKVGPAADVYALGAILFEMLTGRPPFQAATVMDTLIQVIEQPPPDIRSLNPRVPETLAAFCRRCLAKDARDRYPDAGALADDLERHWLQTTRSRRFRKLTLWAALAAVLVCGLEWTLTAWSSRWWATLTDPLVGLAETAGPVIREPASSLFSLFEFVLFLTPLGALLAFFLWLGAWLVSASQRRERRHGVDEPADRRPDSYLDRLVGSRAELTPSSAVLSPAAAAVELADVELGKIIQQVPSCLVRRGHQKSLDRPVLVWLDDQPAPAGTPATGVVVHHPSVLALHAVGSAPEGRFLVTQPLAAMPLAELLERRPLEPLEAAFLLVKVARAVQAFHDQGVRHGRLGPEWILVQGDLEPFLCPCGVPSQTTADWAQDVAALGRLLEQWLPPRPRHWQRQPLAALYRVCDATLAGNYRRPGDFATDLQLAAYDAQVSARERVLKWVVFGLFMIPLLFLAGASFLERLGWLDRSDTALASAARALLENLALLMLAPGIVLLGLIHGRSLVHHARLHVRRAVPGPWWRRGLFPALTQVALATLLPGLMTALVLPHRESGTGSWVGLLAAATLLGYWFLGVILAGLITFGEMLVGTLRARADGLSESTDDPSRDPLARASPREAAGSLGGGSRNRKTSEPGFPT
jgi:serine/threonine protein kinase